MAINPISVPFRDPRRPQDFSGFPNFTVGLQAGRSKATLLIFRSRSIDQFDDAVVDVINQFVTALKSNQAGDFSLGLPTLDVAEPDNLDVVWVDPPTFTVYFTAGLGEYRDVLSYASKSGFPLAVPNLSYPSWVGRDKEGETIGTYAEWVDLPATYEIAGGLTPDDAIFGGACDQPQFSPLSTHPLSGDIVPTIFHLGLARVEGNLRAVVQLRPTTTQVGAVIASFVYFPAGACADHYAFTFKPQLVVSPAISCTQLRQSTPSGLNEPWPISLSPMSWDELDQPSQELAYVVPLDVSPTALRPTADTLPSYKSLIEKLPPARAYSMSVPYCSRPDFATGAVPSTLTRDAHEFPILVCPFAPRVFVDFAWRPSAAYVPLALTPPELGQSIYGSEVVASGVLVSLWPGAIFVARRAQGDYIHIPPLGAGSDLPLVADFGALKPVL